MPKDVTRNVQKPRTEAAIRCGEDYYERVKTRNGFYRREFNNGPHPGDHSTPEPYKALYASRIANDGKVETRSPYWRCRKRPDGQTWLYDGCFGFGGVHKYDISTASSQDYNQAVGILKHKLNYVKGNYGVSLGEMPDTLRSFASLIRDAGRAYKALRRGNYTLAIALLGGARPGSAGGRRFSDAAAKAVARGHITAVWGISPLVDDLFNLQEDIRKAFKQHDRKIVSEFSRKELRSLVTGMDPFEFRVGAKAGVQLRVDDPTLAGLEALGLTNPAVIAWNVLPLSFIVDWFLPIGDFLEYLTLGQGLHMTKGYVTLFSKCNQTQEYSDDWLANFTDVSPSQMIVHTRPSVTISSTAMSRSAFGGFPSMRMVFEQDPLTINKLHSLASLAKLLGR